ncbi:hypothetical protein EG359_20980 [Chryseobacterium joostei]|uniref:Apea-like HEPN domain-containing protein n=1 Tax=Chryseobacterium joostei TaxID=112234 RepID=A0A1N7ICG7_9FLAO|nr:hypothetical protein [Chryseobacterium joostei]AZB01912.1 hypothetical protein EG359_20980 [Chryseobacterium joostei]SIS34757.1 hypothetical protein SAMN05421768_10498 [Chryseobacterium joostei]
MTPNRKQLLLFNDLINWIFKFCPDLEDYNSDLIFDEERINEIITEEEDITEIEFFFLGEQNYTTVIFEEFIDLADQIKSLMIINEGFIKTKNHSFYIVSANDSRGDFILNENHNLQLHVKGKKISVDIVSESIIVGLAACNLAMYDDNYWGTITPYQAINISYEDHECRLNDMDELALLNSYLFEIADTLNIALIRTDIHLPEEYEYLEDEEQYESLRELEPFNEGMKLFTSAVQIEDEELKFLNFYKVLEHYSPIAVNIEANELMRKKLDSPKSKFEDGDFIRSIFQLANSMRDRFNDEDLIKSAFGTCVDFIGLYEELPLSIQKKITGHLKLKKLEYGIDRQQISIASNIAAKIIYKTRNKVVHAKSNFIPDGEEIKSDEFAQLNQFMKFASSQAIRWYARQPNHLKQEIIN